jgi:glutathione S-transferase
MFFEQYELEPALAVVRFWLAYSGNPTGLLDERRAELTKSGNRVLRVLDEHFRTHRYAVGDALSIADISLYAYTHVAHEGGFDLAPHPAVRAWLERVAAEPGHVPIDA